MGKFTDLVSLQLSQRSVHGVSIIVVFPSRNRFIVHGRYHRRELAALPPRKPAVHVAAVEVSAREARSAFLADFRVPAPAPVVISDPADRSSRHSCSPL